jgi:hypothetical protein
MNRIPNPVNLVSKFIIIIVTNLRGKSGGESYGGNQRDNGAPKTCGFALIVNAKAGKRRESRSDGEKNFLTIDYISSSYQG